MSDAEAIGKATAISIHMLQAEIKRQNEREAEIERLLEERDMARDAAREIAEYRPVPEEVRRNWIERFPWLEDSSDE